MRISNFQSKINFQKKQVAKCMVLQDSKPVPCKISLLEDTPEDRRYLLKAVNSPDWQNNHYLDLIEETLNDGISINYVLEDKKGNCLAFCEITKDVYYGKNYTNIVLFESMPSRKKRKFKYLGETLINFIAQISNNPDEKLIIGFSANNAKKFYRKCKFNDGKTKDKFDFIFDKQRLKKLKKQNQNHTGSAIEFIV